MYRGSIVVRVLLAILLVVVIVGGGMAAYRAGWGQGYLAGSAISSSEGVESGLLMPQFGGHMYQSFYPGFGFPFFGLCLGIGFIFLIMFLVGGILKPWGRRSWGRHPHHWEVGPMPPWAKDWEEHQRKNSQQEDETKVAEDDQPTAD